MESGPRVSGLKLTKNQQSRFRRRRKPLQYLFVLMIILGAMLAVSVEISCRVYGDPMPHQDWRVGYEHTPMTDATHTQNCRINTREYWKARSIDWFRDLL